MTIRCKMCGAPVAVPQGITSAVCSKCRAGQPAVQRGNHAFDPVNKNFNISLDDDPAPAARASGSGDTRLDNLFHGPEDFSTAENASMDYAYNTAVRMMNTAASPIQFTNARQMFESLGNYKDSQQMIRECSMRYEFARKDDLYKSAVILVNNCTEADELELAIMQFDSIIDHRDSRQQVQLCRRRIAEIKQREEQEEREKAEQLAREEAEQAAAARKRLILKISVISAAAAAVVGGVITVIAVV